MMSRNDPYGLGMLGICIASGDSRSGPGEPDDAMAYNAGRSGGLLPAYGEDGRAGARRVARASARRRGLRTMAAAAGASPAAKRRTASMLFIVPAPPATIFSQMTPPSSGVFLPITGLVQWCRFIPGNAVLFVLSTS
jgi:hypothetical protein